MTRVGFADPFHPRIERNSPVEVRASKTQLFLHCSSSYPCGLSHRVHRSTRFTAIPKPLYRHHCEGRKSGRDRDRRLTVSLHGEAWLRKGTRRCCQPEPALPSIAVNVLSWLWGV